MVSTTTRATIRGSLPGSVQRHKNGTSSLKTLILFTIWPFPGFQLPGQVPNGFRTQATVCRVARVLLRERGTKVTDLQLCQKLHKQERCTRAFGRDQLRCSQEGKNSTPSRQASGENSLEHSASSLTNACFVCWWAE